MAPVGPRVVHSDVIQRSLLDDKCVLLSVFLEAILGIFGVFVKLYVLKEPGDVQDEFVGRVFNTTFLTQYSEYGVNMDQRLRLKALLAYRHSNHVSCCACVK